MIFLQAFQEVFCVVRKSSVSLKEQQIKYPVKFSKCLKFPVDKTEHTY